MGLDMGLDNTRSVTVKVDEITFVIPIKGGEFTVTLDEFSSLVKRRVISVKSVLDRPAFIKALALAYPKEQ